MEASNDRCNNFGSGIDRLSSCSRNTYVVSGAGYTAIHESLGLGCSKTGEASRRLGEENCRDSTAKPTKRISRLKGSHAITISEMTFDTSNRDASRITNSNRIEICGGIASGKTTLARVMELAGHHAVFENFRLNPFIENFYSNTELYSFETEISFLLQHYSQIKTEARRRESFICDYSLYLDSSYAHVTLQPSHLQIFKVLHGTVANEIGPPALLVHLRCSSRIELERIRDRHRTMENAITIQYLDGINHALEEHVSQATRSTKILEIDSEKLDFAHESIVQREVANLITAALPFPVG